MSLALIAAALTRKFSQLVTQGNFKQLFSLLFIHLILHSTLSHPLHLLHLLCISAVAINFARVDGDTQVPGKIVCYFSTWASGRPSPMNYDLDDVPGDKCTHLIYSFIGIHKDSYTLFPIDYKYDLERSEYWSIAKCNKEPPCVINAYKFGQNRGIRAIHCPAEQISQYKVTFGSWRLGRRRSKVL